MNEPTTVITDYVLGAVSIFLSLRLMDASRFWALAFFALGLGALLGGTWHGFWQQRPAVEGDDPVGRRARASAWWPAPPMR